MQATSRRSAAAGPAAGFGVLLGKELLEARRSKRIIVFVLVMTVAVVLVAVVGYLRIHDFGGGGRHVIREDDMQGMLVAWGALVGFLGSLMLISSTVDAVSPERALGISAWIVTKPVSRLAYLSAKAVAHTAVGVTALVVIPSAVWLTLMLLFFQGVPAGPIVGATLILCVEMAFLSFFIVALGVPFRSVPPIAMIGLAVWFLPNFVHGIESVRWTDRVLPSYLPIAAVTAAAAETDASTFTVPLASIVAAVVLFGIAVVMFERQEL